MYPIEFVFVNEIPGFNRGLTEPGGLHPKVPPRIFFWEEFKRRLDGEFWKSPDITVAEETVLQAGKEQYVPVVIPTYPAMAPFEGLPVDSLAFAEISTRSRYAQLGVEIAHDAVHEIARSIDFQSQARDGFLAEVSVKNRSPRAIRIPEAAGLFKLYAQSSLCRFNERLVELIEKGKVSIDGKKDIDWGFDVLFNEYSRRYETTGIWLRLDPKKRLWLPPDPKGRPLEIPEGSEANYRRAIDKHLKPVPVSEEPIHWVGETVSRIKLDPKVNAVIVAMSPEGMRHANSILINGGTNWRIRTEIVSRTVLNPITVIFLHFYT